MIKFVVCLKSINLWLMSIYTPHLIINIQQISKIAPKKIGIFFWSHDFSVNKLMRVVVEVRVRTMGLRVHFNCKGWHGTSTHVTLLHAHDPQYNNIINTHTRSSQLNVSSWLYCNKSSHLCHTVCELYPVN